MPSDTKLTEAFVWIWLPESTAPVVAGKLTADGAALVFNYGTSYLDRHDAIPIFTGELPLKRGVLPVRSGLTMPSCLRDAAPDAWGRRVIINRKLGLRGVDASAVELGELAYLLESGSDRIGALDFQASPTVYIPRETTASLAELQDAARLVEQGVPLTPELGTALQNGTSIGGARPKALIVDGERKYIAKFSASTDLYSVVKAEFIAMRLAALAGIRVASVQMTTSAGKEVLLIERFDRLRQADGWSRRGMVSALTLLGLDEMMARYASYEDLAEIIRHDFINAPDTLRELFSRIVFNILSGNTDDHARNHAAFTDGEMLELTPAYDICPQGRAGNEASQAMLIMNNQRMSQLALCVQAAHIFQLGREEALAIIDAQCADIRFHWKSVCDEAEVSEADRQLLWERQFFNPYVFEGLDAVR